MESFKLLFFILFGIIFADAEYVASRDCYLPGGVLGKCIPFDECDHLFHNIASRFHDNPPNPVRCEKSTKYCCQYYPTHVAKQVCRKYMDDARGSRVGELIARGEKVDVGELPHMVALGILSGTSIQFVCGGTLISSWFILTAAHCIKPKRIYYARLGVNKIDDNYNPEIDFEVDEVIKHDDHDPKTGTNDIALLRLATETNLTRNLIFPACLNTEVEHSEKQMIISGWGQVTAFNTTTSKDLLKAIVTRTPLEYCRESLIGRPVTERQICAENTTTNADTCPGDSGGPLQIFIGNANYTLYNVIGVTSFGKSACGIGNPGVYARVSYYLDWIVKRVWPKSGRHQIQSWA